MLDNCLVSQSCAHPFFDELRRPETTMPDKSPLAPELFQFTNEEVSLMPEILDAILPPHIKAQRLQQQQQMQQQQQQPSPVVGSGQPSPVAAAVLSAPEHQPAVSSAPSTEVLENDKTI